MKVADAQNKLADALKRVAATGERIPLKRGRKTVAALVSPEDLELLERVEDESDIRAARKALKEKGGISLEELKKKYEYEPCISSSPSHQRKSK